MAKISDLQRETLITGGVVIYGMITTGLITYKSSSNPSEDDIKKAKQINRIGIAMLGVGALAIIAYSWKVMGRN